MLDFRPSSAKSASMQAPHYKQNVDYGRLLMMVTSSILLLGLIFSIGRPRQQSPAGPPAMSAQGASDQLSSGSRVTLVGGAILAAALCVVASVMFVLYRMAGPGRVHFAVHDVAESEPDFRSLEAQPPAPTPREALASVAFAEEMTDTPAESTDPNVGSILVR